MKLCNHHEVRCLNQYELIRKYQCLDCGVVMMCKCDETTARKFLSHQINEGTELETQKRVPVTGGFCPKICRECRGLPPEAHPMASIPGRTSNIRRYYWRELAFREMELFDEWATKHDITTEKMTEPAAIGGREEVKKQALEEIKLLHATKPKYTYNEESQAEIIRKYNIDVIDLKGMYQKTDGQKSRLLDAGEQLSPEEFVRRHFARQGYKSLVLESRPFHVLFGVYMWLVIQDVSDPHVQPVVFRDRKSFEEGLPSHQIWTHLPDDFGTSGYGLRRKAEIRHHLFPGMQNREELEWLFNYWLSDSEPLRQYLWAHRKEDVGTARQLIRILPPEIICNILNYLIDDYWGRYCGWPDLLIYRDNEFYFAEVKSSGDKLSEDQKNWIRGNYSILGLPFKLVKIHRI